MRTISIIIAMCLVFALASGTSVFAGNSDKDEMEARHKMEKIDLIANEVLEQLFNESAEAKELYDKAHGYAVFDNLKLAFMISGGTGSGVAVEAETKKRTYMNMGTGGIGFGIGGQKYQVVFLFQTEERFRDFVDNGWKADASAHAAVGDEGANIQAKFVNGLAVYMFTDKGLMLQADIAGTKYWKNDKLNMYAESKIEGEEKEEKKK